MGWPRIRKTGASALLVVGCLLSASGCGGSGRAQQPVTPPDGGSAVAPGGPAAGSPAAGSPAAGSPAAPARSAAAAPRIIRALIPYPARRRSQMADYSRRHYGVAAWRLRNPRRVVLHYTAGGTAAGTRATFAANTPNRGELPGTCAHYVVDKNGDIYRLVPDTIRCRHAIGLNHVSLGIEMVQDAMSPPGAAERQILARGPQIRAALRLVRYLLDKHHLPIGAVIGHGTANDDRLFRDDEGWRNDHVDWPAPQVREFRRRLRGLR